MQDVQDIFPIIQKQYYRNLCLRNEIAWNIRFLTENEHKEYDFPHVYSQNDLARRIAELTDGNLPYWSQKINRFCSPTNPQAIKDDDWNIICKIIPDIADAAGMLAQQFTEAERHEESTDNQ